MKIASVAIGLGPEAIPAKANQQEPWVAKHAQHHNYVQNGVYEARVNHGASLNRQDVCRLPNSG